jgi:hypothetical protein
VRQGSALVRNEPETFAPLPTAIKTVLPFLLALISGLAGRFALMPCSLVCLDKDAGKNYFQLRASAVTPPAKGTRR